MKNLKDLTLVKETERAYCFKGFEDTTFWCPKSWFKDGFLKEERESEFKASRRLAFEKTRFDLRGVFLKIEETEKAVKLATTLTLFNKDMTEVARTFWCPKSCLDNFDFLYKKIEEVKATLSCRSSNPLDKLMDSVVYEDDEL